MLDLEERYEALRNLGYPPDVARLPRADQVAELGQEETLMRVLKALLLIGDIPNV